MTNQKNFNIDGLTVNRLVASSIARNPGKPALSRKSAKTWITITYKEFDEKVRQFSIGLRSMGIERGDRIALLSENRPEWAIADIAILAAGGVTVPIYSTLPPAQVAHILADSGSRGVIISDAKQLNKVELSRDRCPDLTVIISMDDEVVDSHVTAFAEVLKRGASYVFMESYEERLLSVKPEDLASLVYTSGTTGEPKGTMLSHQNFAAAVQMADIWFPVQPDDRFLSFLPLCHVFERVTHFLSLSLGTHTYYAESIFKVQENMAESHPVIMQSVPRLFEAMHERIMETISKATPRKKALAGWALSVGAEYAQKLNSGTFISPLLQTKYVVADLLVLGKIRARLGGKLRFFVSGGAPLAKPTAEFFNSINIPILEGYGLTETTAPLTCNPYRRAKVGSVGNAFAAVTLKIASDGEVLAKGPNVMSGYWNNPEASHAMFDDEGWLRTGDIGEIDSAGYLSITDRKKDIIVLANGKNVAPQPIESMLKRSPYIAEIVLIGDKSGTVSALVLPDFSKMDWLKNSKPSREPGSYDAGELVKVKKEIKAEIERLSTDLADFEKVRKIALLSAPLTIENGELTPTMKVRRKVVFEHFGKLLD